MSTNETAAVFTQLVEIVALKVASAVMVGWLVYLATTYKSYRPAFA